VWPNVVPDVELPMQYGDYIVLGCSEGFANVGDVKVMCAGSNNYVGAPLCREGGLFHLILVR